MRHLEIGSCNRVFQLQGTYVELVGDLEKSPPALRDKMLPRYEVGEGIAIVSLTSNDLPADHKRASASGLNPSAIVNARRPITMPDGKQSETDSHCFYVWRPDHLYGTLFLSEHYRPETIFIPEYMQHPNGVQRVAELTYISNDPESEVAYFSALLERPPLESSNEVVRFQTWRGESIERIS